MKDEFVFRLRNREINPEYSEMRELKEYLCRLHLEITRKSDYQPWTMENLEEAISKLKNNKCKDPPQCAKVSLKHVQTRPKNVQRTSYLRRTFLYQIRTFKKRTFSTYFLLHKLVPNQNVQKTFIQHFFYTTKLERSKNVPCTCFSNVIMLMTSD